MAPSKTCLHPPWLDKASRVIDQGGLVAVPFERLFGIAGDAENPNTIAQVIAAKKRAANSTRQPISVIAASLSILDRLIDCFPDLARRLASRYWPGPVTILVPAARNAPDSLVSDRGLIGVRLPGPSPARELAEATGKILTATSANRTGEADIVCHESLQHLQLKEIDFIVEGRVAGPPGSTVVDASGKSPRVLRQGAVTIEWGS